MNIAPLSLTEFWRKLNLDQSVHPCDREALSAWPHSFNTDEPPPAFIGDIERAPVIVLVSNGGWNTETAKEFLQPHNSPADYVTRLHNSTACDPSIVSPYYARSNLKQFLARGDVALLNLIPYRSPELSKEPENLAFAPRLWSSQIAVQWVNEVAMPQAQSGTRLMILKRGIWLKFVERRWHPNLVDTQRRGPHVSVTALRAISTFVKQMRSLDRHGS
jgi:hypothetical protein